MGTFSLTFLWELTILVYMEVITRKVITDFIRRHPDSKSSIEAWYSEAINSVWEKSMDIKKMYSSASFLGKNIVIFNIKGNSYRLITKIAYNNSTVYIKWIGTHSEYDKLDISSL